MATRAHTVPRFYLNGFAAPEAEYPFLWVGSLVTDEITRRSPKNWSIVKGLYDGPGAFSDISVTLESCLSKIESDAATAIRRYVATDPTQTSSLPGEIMRFLAWQAARTPGWMQLEEDWVYEWDPDEVPDIVEAPPDGADEIKKRTRKLCVEHPDTGERRDTTSEEEFCDYIRNGWKWIFDNQDRLESLHLQAWYFQVRHFPRLSWVRLTAPPNQAFIINDRGVSWVVDGLADTPPAALRHSTAQVIAPLTCTTVLVGRHGNYPLNCTPQEVNRLIACTASDWIAGPSEQVVQETLRARRALMIK